MHHWLKPFLVAAIFTCLGADAQQVSNAGSSEVKVVGFFNTISRKDSSESFFMVVDEYEGEELSRQSICIAGDGLMQEFNPKSIFRCESTAQTRIVFRPDGSFKAFGGTVSYAKRVYGRNVGANTGSEHTFDLQFHYYGTMNNFTFLLRRVRGDQVGRWSNHVGVRANRRRNDYTCEAFEDDIRCLWTPVDKTKETITWFDYGPEFSEDQENDEQ